jgi:hypothetical protein
LAALDVDLEKDLFHIVYEPKKLTPRRIVEVVAEQGFEGTVLPAAPAGGDE